MLLYAKALKLTVFKKLTETTTELERKLKEAEKELRDVQTSFRTVCKERDAVTEQITKAQFSLSDAKQQLAEMQSKVTVFTLDIGLI